MKDKNINFIFCYRQITVSNIIQRAFIVAAAVALCLQSNPPSNGRKQQQQQHDDEKKKKYWKGKHFYLLCKHCAIITSVVSLRRIRLIACWHKDAEIDIPLSMMMCGLIHRFPPICLSSFDLPCRSFFCLLRPCLWFNSLRLWLDPVAVGCLATAQSQFRTNIKNAKGMKEEGAAQVDNRTLNH